MWFSSRYVWLPSGVINNDNCAIGRHGPTFSAIKKLLSLGLASVEWVMGR